MPRPSRFTHGKDPVPIVYEVEWAPRLIWTGAENLIPTRIRSPDRPAHNMDCEFGQRSSWLEKIGVNVKSCPDNQYCCYEDDHVYCCSSSEFVSNSFAGLLPILVAVAVGFLIVCCLCCLCCPCCLLYKRRHRGTVYGRVQTVVTTPQPAQQQASVYAPQPTPMPVPLPMPGYSQTTGYPMYTAQAGQQPPPYSEVTASEVYAKQAPYNPSFQ